MIWRYALTFFAALAVAYGGGSYAATPGVLTHKVESVRPVLEILDRAGVSGSLEFNGGTCKLSNLPEFPILSKATTNPSPVQALREMFAIDAAMQVTQDSDGIIRMSEIGVPTDILKLKIGELRFERPNAYYPNAVLDRMVLQRPEFKAFIRKNRINYPLNLDWGFGALGNPNPLPEWPHVSGSLHDVTLSEALDDVLKTFPGIWIYENCPAAANKPRTIYFHFVYYRGRGSDMHIME